jgi:geranylgeranyl diphosphate synthase type I
MVMMAMARGMDEQMVIDQTELLDAVQEFLRASIAAAPWPPALADVVTGILSEPTRTLGGRATPWVLMPLYCCAAVCGEWRRGLPVATASELYITALDLFDDVEDGDASAAVERYGVPVVLNAATALLALAQHALEPSPAEDGGVDIAARRSAQDALWRGLLVATGGQHLDLVAAGAPSLSVDDCLDIARRKGGALAEACCRAGAALGTDDAGLIERCGLLGRSIGLYGQLDNDMHDAGSNTGKSDLERCKPTLPITIARAGDTSSALSDAVWQGGIQLTYALLHAERARAQDTLEELASACPNPAFAQAVLERLLARNSSPSTEVAV